MADTTPPAQPAAAPESAANTHTDPVTGEQVSKSELKRRQKEREREAKKAEKAKSLPVQPKKEGKKEEVELNPNASIPVTPSMASTNALTAVFRAQEQQDQCAAIFQDPEPVSHFPSF